MDHGPLVTVLLGFQTNGHSWGTGVHSLFLPLMDPPGPFGESPVVEKGNSGGRGGRGSVAWAGGRVAEVTAGGPVREGMGLAKGHPSEHRSWQMD